LLGATNGLAVLVPSDAAVGFGRGASLAVAVGQRARLTQACGAEGIEARQALALAGDTRVDRMHALVGVAHVAIGAHLAGNA